MPKLEEQLNEQTLKGTVSVNDQNLQQALIETAVLDDLNDVAISSPTNGQILQYNSADSTWKNENNIIPNGDKGDITVTSAGTVWTIDNNAVVEDKINTGAVTEVKIGTGAVTETKIGTGAVTETKIGTGAVTEIKIGTGAVTETKIADSAVTENKVANNAVTANKIANDSVTNSKLANMATATVKGRATAGTGDPEDLAIDNDLTSVSTNDDTIPSAKAVKAYVDALKLVIYPIGAIYTSVVNTNPSTFLGGTWTAFGSGRTLVGVDTGQTEFDTVEETGGVKTHTHTINSHTHSVTTSNHTHSVTTSNHTHTVSGNTSSAQGGFGAFASGSLSPDGNHTHNVNITSSSNGGQTITSSSAGAETVTSAGSGTLTSNSDTTLQPYITVYFWKRTA